jgi:hypothetical protein
VSDADDEAMAAAQELLRLAGEQLDEDMADLGLYVNDKQIIARPDAPSGMGVLWTGVLGRVAFSDRVLNPEAVVVADEFDQITAALSDDTFEARRRRLLGHDE